MKMSRKLGPASPAGVRSKTGHRSVRGKISGPIPIPNPMEDDEFPIRKPGSSMASQGPLVDADVLERPMQQIDPLPLSPTSQSSSAVAQPSTPAVLVDGVVDIPIPTLVERASSILPQPPQTPRPSGPSPDGAASSGVSAARSSPIRLTQISTPGTNRLSAVSVTSNKMTESAASGRQVLLNTPPPQRKKSTFRSALSRLLRRKKHPGSLTSVKEVGASKSALSGPPPQHRSVPPAARIEPVPTEEPSKRVASMPIHEFNRALRSHSIGPDDITAIEDARNSLSIDTLGLSPSRRRSATTTTKTRKLYVIGPHGLRGRADGLAGLSPRPASTHARSSRMFEQDTAEIGRAITSDTSGADLGQKRRSRSLSQLNELAQEQGAGARRRSDEIRFWRESYDVPGPLSPLSSLPNENETDCTNEENLDQAWPSVAMTPGTPAIDKAPQTPPQPFQFGSLAHMNEMAGMRITQAVSFEKRLDGLDHRMQRLERVVDQLCHSVPGFKGPLMELVKAGAGAAGPASGRHRSSSGVAAAHGPGFQPASAAHHPQHAYSSSAMPPTLPSIYPTQFAMPSSRQSGDTTLDNNSTPMSSGDGLTYNDSLHAPSSSATHNPSTAATSATSVPPVPVHSLLRPISDATGRPATTSMPWLASLGFQGSLGEEQSSNSATLIVQLDAERAARQALEGQVCRLSERMNNLSSTMYAIVRDPAKSKPSPLSERPRPQTTVSPGTTAGVDTYPANAAKAAVGLPAIDSSCEAQSIIFGSMASPPAKDVGDDDFSEPFQTPREVPSQPSLPPVGRFPGVEELGGVGWRPKERREKDDTDNKDDDADDDEGSKMTAAVRTLSLSQLTMG